MKKFVLVIGIMLSLISTSAYAAKESIVKEEVISSVIDECYPNLKVYYEAGLLNIKSLTVETLLDGSTEYDIRYNFTKSFCKSEEAEKILKEEYPILYRLNEDGFIKDVMVYKYVDKTTGEILSQPVFNKGDREIKFPRPAHRR